MSTSETLDVTRVRTIQARAHKGLRVALLTNRPAGDLVRGKFPEPGFMGIVREKGKLTDLVSTFSSAVFLLSDHFKDALERHELSGWRAAPVSIAGFASVKALWLLTVSGTCGRLYGVDGDPVPSVRVGNLLDPAQWDGSDLFMADNHNAIFVTPRSTELLQAMRLTNLELRQEGIEALIRD